MAQKPTEYRFALNNSGKGPEGVNDKGRLNSSGDHIFSPLTISAGFAMSIVYQYA